MFLPDHIDVSKSERYNLSIRITADELSFTLFQPETKAFCYRERQFFKEMSLLENLKQAIFDMSFLTQKFAQTDVVIVSPNYEFVPDYIFEKGHIDDLFSLTHCENAGRVLESSKRFKNKITLFDIDPELHDFLIRSLFDPIFHHHINLLAAHFANKSSFVPSTGQMHISFNQNYIDVFCFQNKRMRHIVTYKNISEQDFVYYVLNLWDKCKFKQMGDNLYIYGDSPIKVGVLAILKEYISKIEQSGMPSDVQLFGLDAQKTPLDVLTLSL